MDTNEWIIVGLSAILIILIIVRMCNYDNKINVITPSPAPEPLKT